MVGSCVCGDEYSGSSTTASVSHLYGDANKMLKNGDNEGLDKFE